MSAGTSIPVPVSSSSSASDSWLLEENPIDAKDPFQVAAVEKSNDLFLDLNNRWRGAFLQDMLYQQQQEQSRNLRSFHQSQSPSMKTFSSVTPTPTKNPRVQIRKRSALWKETSIVYDDDDNVGDGSYTSASRSRNATPQQLSKERYHFSTPQRGFGSPPPQLGFHSASNSIPQKDFGAPPAIPQKGFGTPSSPLHPTTCGFDNDQGVIGLTQNINSEQYLGAPSPTFPRLQKVKDRFMGSPTRPNREPMVSIHVSLSNRDPY